MGVGVMVGVGVGVTVGVGVAVGVAVGVGVGVTVGVGVGVGAVPPFKHELEFPPDVQRTRSVNKAALIPGSVPSVARFL